MASLDALSACAETHVGLTAPTVATLRQALSTPKAVYNVYLKNAVMTKELLQTLKSSDFTIKSLVIEECEGTLDLRGMPNLETLRISSDSISTPHLIAGCRSLKHFILSTRSDLPGPSFEDLPLLESIDMRSCPNLYADPIIARCPALTCRQYTVNPRAHPNFNFCSDF